MKITLRLLTVLAYFLPVTFCVVTCGGPGAFDLTFSYNQKEADANNLRAKAYQQRAAEEDTLIAESSQVVPNDSESVVGTESVVVGGDSSNVELVSSSDSSLVEPTTISQKLSSFWDDITVKAMAPSDSSLSGVGSIFYFKNLIGQILITISLLISLFCLLRFGFLKSHRLKKLLLLFNISFFLMFIVVSIISDVTLRWGAAVLLFLLTSQLILETRLRHGQMKK